MAELRHASATGEVVADGRMTFGEVALRWRERVLDARELAPSTSDRYRWMLDRVVAELGTRRLRSLTVDDVERALDRLAAGTHRREGREDTPITRSTLTPVARPRRRDPRLRRAPPPGQLERRPTRRADAERAEGAQTALAHAR